MLKGPSEITAGDVLESLYILLELVNHFLGLTV